MEHGCCVCADLSDGLEGKENGNIGGCGELVQLGDKMAQDGPFPVRGPLSGVVFFGGGGNIRGFGERRGDYGGDGIDYEKAGLLRREGWGGMGEEG